MGTVSRSGSLQKQNPSRMNKQDLELLLLKTVFCCMASDQTIDAAEIAHIQERGKDMKLFGDLDQKQELKRMEGELNAQGYGFFRHYFAELAVAGLDRDQELIVLGAAIDMVEANEEVEYAEIKFVKLIRSELKVTDEEILGAHPGSAEYLKQDIATKAATWRSACRSWSATTRSWTCPSAA